MGPALIGLSRINVRGNCPFRTRGRCPAKSRVNRLLEGTICKILTRRRPSQGTVVRVLPSHSFTFDEDTRLLSESAGLVPFCSMIVGSVDPRGGRLRVKFGTRNLKPWELRGLSGTRSGLDTRVWGALLAGEADRLLLSLAGGERSEAGSRLRRGDASRERDELPLNDQLCRLDFPVPPPRDDDRQGCCSGATIKSSADRRLTGLRASITIGGGNSWGRKLDLSESLLDWPIWKGAYCISRQYQRMQLRVSCVVLMCYRQLEGDKYLSKMPFRFTP
jgi:hypothetical protein